MAENLLRIVVQDDGRPPPRAAAPAASPGAGPSGAGPASPPRAVVPSAPPPPARPPEFRPGHSAFDELFDPTPAAPKIYEPPAADPLSDSLGFLTDDADDLAGSFKLLTETVAEAAKTVEAGGTYGFAGDSPAASPVGDTYGFAEETRAEPASAEPPPIPLAGDEGTYGIKPERATPVVPDNTNPLFEANARGINRLAEANRQLAESLGDGSYLAQAKELVQLRDEELQLARAAADQELKARYGATAPTAKGLDQYGQALDAGPSWLRPVVAGVGGGKGGTLGAVADLAGAGGMGGMAGALEAAGGPIGLVAAAAQAAGAALDGMKAGIERTGQGLTALAGNDGLGMLKAATGLVTDTLHQIPIVGDALAKQFEVATAAVTAYAQVTEAFIQRGKELSKYNADLAAANAQASVTRLEADLKESEAVGKSLAKLTENQADTESNLRDLILPIKEAIADFLAEFSGVTSEVTGIAKEFAPVIKFFADLALALPTEILRLIGTVLKELHDWLPKNPFRKPDPQPGDLNMLMQQLFQSLDRIPPQGGFAGVAGPAAGAPQIGGGPFGGDF